MSTDKICKVSIILPTYNRGDLLPRAVNSVIQQTFSDWEMILWDDGSTDNTKEIVSRFSDNRIKFYFDENRGVSYARNRALEKAGGKYIAFLDSDDEWVNEKLERQVSIMETYPQIDALFGNFANINLARGGEGDGFAQDARSMAHLSTDHIENGIFLIAAGMPEILALGNFIATDTMMIRREVFDRVGGFNEGLRNSEDFELWWRVGLAGIQFAYVVEILMTRYKPAGSLSSPGLESSRNTLKALDLCRENSISAGRADHLRYLDRLYRNTWQNMITAYGAQRQLGNSFGAFFRSCRYGFRPGALRLLINAMLTAATQRNA